MTYRVSSCPHGIHGKQHGTAQVYHRIASHLCGGAPAFVALRVNNAWANRGHFWLMLPCTIFHGFVGVRLGRIKWHSDARRRKWAMTSGTFSAFGLRHSSLHLLAPQGGIPPPQGGISYLQGGIPLQGGRKCILYTDVGPPGGFPPRGEKVY